MAKLVICSAKPPGGTGSFYFMSTLEYKGLETKTGIAILTESRRSPQPLYDTGELMRVGWLERIIIIVQQAPPSGTTPGRYSNSRIFCTPEKRKALIEEAKGEGGFKWGGKDVVGVSAGIRQRIYRA